MLRDPRLATAAAWLFSCVIPVRAAVYYVATTGSDGAPGTLEKPWATIQMAASTMVAGDTVYVRAGTYSERVVPQASGTAAGWIRYRTYPGETAVIDGAGVSLPAGWGGLLEISARDYIEVSGLTVMNVGPDDNHMGILVENASHVLIQGCKTSNTASSGIGIWSSADVSILDNEIELACNDGEEECLTVAQTDGFDVAGNWVHDGGPGSLGGEGIDVKDGSRNGAVHDNLVERINRLGIYVDSWDKHTHDVEVYGNTVRDSSDGIVVAAENGGLLERVRVYDNLVYGNEYVGFIVAGWGEPTSHPMSDITVINNTFHDNGRSWGGGILHENPEATGVVLRNNIVSRNLSFQIALDAGVAMPTVDHNLVDGFRGEPGEIRGTDYVEGDPLFVSAAGHDFHLQEGSPAIDQGSAEGAPSKDFEGLPRPAGVAWDMGAFEWAAGVVFGDGFESGDTSAW